MDRNYDFFLGSMDPEITGVLKTLDPQPLGLERRFNQEEDFFLTLEQSFIVPSFPIHHAVAQRTPSPEYLQMIRQLVRVWAQALPAVFSGLNWFFDPRDIFHPLFLQVLSSKERRYLYVLKVDLTYRNRYGQIVQRGDNDRTPEYSTPHLFLESEILPLDAIEDRPGADGATAGKLLYLKKMFQNTWKGESGRGYFVTGQWIDQEITKFLSRMLVPTGQKTFPFYPFRCRFNTISVTCVQLSPEGRKKTAALLDAVWALVVPRTAEIQAALTDAPFSDDHPLYQAFHSQVSPLSAPRLGAYRLESYLNDADQKEYRYYDELE